MSKKPSLQPVTQAFTELAPRYELVVDHELNRFWGWSYQGFVEKLVTSTAFSNGDRILDIATGTAAIPLQLVKASGENQITCQVVGLDITLAMLRRARGKIQALNSCSLIDLAGGDAMKMPFCGKSFDVVVCGLATHHMQVPLLLSEIRRVLKDGGKLTLADAGGSQIWNHRFIRILISGIAFIYFLFKETPSRAWAEASAVNNIQTSEDWHSTLAELGFKDIKITNLRNRHSWVPGPLIITATTPHNHFIDQVS